MGRYAIGADTVDTAWARQSWTCESPRYGRETLHRIPSMPGWYLEIEDPASRLEEISPAEAADWLMEAGETVPRDLAEELGIPESPAIPAMDDELAEAIVASLGGR